MASQGKHPRRSIKNRDLRYLPDGNEFAIVDEAVGVRVPVGDEEGDEDVEEERELAGDVEEEEILRQASEEGEFEGGEEGGVDCPY